MPNSIATNELLIGASLSKPHTSVTALRMHVCIYICLFVGLFGLTTYRNEHIQIFHDDGMSTPMCNSGGVGLGGEIPCKYEGILSMVQITCCTDHY